MGWELRRGKLVYYRKVRDGSRVRSVYCGAGERGEQAAREDEERRKAKLARQVQTTNAPPAPAAPPAVSVAEPPRPAPALVPTPASQALYSRAPARVPHPRIGLDAWRALGRRALYPRDPK
jgi:hypothetical protein